ncbi:MAG: hypothetical protein JSW00_17545 [Thermoplasmata archaeon]|nr:MAG: hypothetical protein JSW00_17545 [Thermoplasmata archaeon]
MAKKQSILEDFGEVTQISIKDIAGPSQKYIHFWDFMELDDKVHEFQAKMEIAMRDLKEDMRKRYKNYFTRAYIQSPDKFLRHARELQEIEYMLDNPFFLAILHFALTKDVDERELRLWAITSKKRLMDKRHDIKENLEQEIKARNELLVK